MIFIAKEFLKSSKTGIILPLFNTKIGSKALFSEFTLKKLSDNYKSNKKKPNKGFRKCQIY